MDAPEGVGGGGRGGECLIRLPFTLFSILSVIILWAHVDSFKLKKLSKNLVTLSL